MKTDAIKNLNILTTIPTQTLKKLFEKLMLISCEAIEESQLGDDNITEIDIGIGNLVIRVDEDGVVYKFIPNHNFETNIKDTIINKKNPMVNALEKTFADRFIKTYKDLL